MFRNTKKINRKDQRKSGIIKVMTIRDGRQLNGLALAYIGDAIYELKIREQLLQTGLTKVNELQRASRQYVSAKAHAAIWEAMLADELIREEELIYFKRGRNANSHTKAKNTDVVTYRISTGVEALFGYWYVTEQHERIDEIIDWIVEQVQSGRTRQGVHNG